MVSRRTKRTAAKERLASIDQENEDLSEALKGLGVDDEQEEGDQMQVFLALSVNL